MAREDNCCILKWFGMAVCANFTWSFALCDFSGVRSLDFTFTYISINQMLHTM
ncbi:hypothetical protein BofuT4_uP029650.1 [Botrytis cinerea T4]|uniref:Uncharacterized protein n=1 Tax=Botryotinia fuckeliana (strain T4) TaxID=999810 RepID=G2Y913_BOTF4|nr:hypothetical protein BofuT4_uP029650.1 [Botrytis cinerea T4]